MIRAAAESLGANHPRLLEYLDTLNASGVPYGAFSGFVLQAAGIRPTDDLDLLTAADGFDTAAGLLPGAAVNHTQVRYRCDDGDHMDFTTREATATLDGLEVQILEPAPMHTRSGGEYHLAMTPLAASRRWQYMVGGVLVPIANPADTLAAKAAMRRGAAMGKRDGADIRALAAIYPLDEDYFAARAKEIGLDAPAHAFIARHAGQTVLRGAYAPARPALAIAA